MSDTVISCTCCGYQIVFPADTPVMVCPACQAHNALPCSNGPALNMLQRAVEQRLACDFNAAEQSYQQVLVVNPDEHEALWGRLLCSYGVEYVEDPATRRRMPTVHTVRSKPLQEQQDFIKACEFAPKAIRAQYELDAAYIDDAQANIRALAKSCQPYDVFLCHKTTKPGTNDKTEDFHRATQLYHFLKDQGVRAFFAPESLPHAAGANYEAGIYHALQTARVMLVICSDADYLTSAWVRSEWSRYLEWMEKEPERQLIPLLYDHFSPSKLPAPFRFRRLQGMDMTEITAPQTLLEVIAKAVENSSAPSESPAEAPVTPEPQPQPSPESIPAKPAQSQPEAPSATPQNVVTLEFPNPHPMRKDIAALELSVAPGNFQPVEWGSTLTVPVEYSTEYAVHSANMRRAGKVLFWIFIVIGLLSGIAMILVDHDIHPIMACLVFTCMGLFLGVIFNISIVSSSKLLRFTVTPGARYTLYWKKSLLGQYKLYVETK